MKNCRIALCSLAATSALLAGACSSDSSDDSADTSTTAANDEATTTEASDATVVNIEVSDTEGESGPMTMTVSTETVPAGEVQFLVDNTGTVEHEVVILKTDIPYTELEVDADGKVSEEDSVGEVAEFEAGTSSGITLDLEPGSYVLVCNIANHYEMGMVAPFTVT